MILSIIYLISTILFIVGLKRLGSPVTATNGNMVSIVGMGLAILVTFLDPAMKIFLLPILGLLAGSIVGIYLGYSVEMTGMPEMVALLNGLGGLSSVLVSCACIVTGTECDIITIATILISIIIGGITFTGSVVAWGKLKISGKVYALPKQQIINGILIVLISLIAGYALFAGYNFNNICSIIVISCILGIFAVLPIGGADMPVVISLLNSLSGVAASAAGFVVSNNLLIIAGALVGASGIILTVIMCKAMNRSLTHVLFHGINSGKSAKIVGEIHEKTVQEAYYVLEAAQSVVVVPGYGLAVAQAQHAIRELGELLMSKGAEVAYAIHPVAGRMPGHMNVLLAEANVSYDQLVEMDIINERMDSVDVCMIIGANDVVNTAARDDKNSPIYGMPIIEVDRAQNIFVLKRSMASGYAGIDNPVFYNSKTSMVFGDAKGTIQSIIAEFKR